MIYNSTDREISVANCVKNLIWHELSCNRPSDYNAFSGVFENDFLFVKNLYGL